MLGAPLNDQKCLSQIADVAIAAMARPDVQDLAARLGSTRAVVRYLRRLPQRDDAPNDATAGPRVACDVPQRVRVPATDPNCVERSAIYLALAELIDPVPLRHLVTIDTPAGRHTFPVEAGRPVCLDPRAAPRNALAAGLHLVRNARGEVGRLLSPLASLAWAVDLAGDAARGSAKWAARHKGAARDVARIARGLAPLEPAALGWALGLAVPEALAFGPDGQAALMTAAGLLDELAGNSNSATATSPKAADPHRASASARALSPTTNTNTKQGE